VIPDVRQRQVTLARRIMRALLIALLIVLLIVRYAVQQYFRKEMAWPAEESAKDCHAATR
jgi:hypothetical protein